VTMKTPENPGLKTSLCGKCEDGYALIPATFLKFKILGVCNFIRRLPLWARATNKERLKYNERSCRFFYSYKGWSLKKDFLAHSSKWKKIREQMSNAKRAHAYHCVMTSLTKDGALGEFRDPEAYDELKKRKSTIKEVQAGEGWNYDAVQLKVAKFSSCYTYLQARPKLTCDKETQTVECLQIQVHSTQGWLKSRSKASFFPLEIHKTHERKGDFTWKIISRPSWWNKDKMSKQSIIIDTQPFHCDAGKSGHQCREEWGEKRAEKVANLAMADEKQWGDRSAEYKKCRRISTESALSLQ